MFPRTRDKIITIYMRTRYLTVDEGLVKPSKIQDTISPASVDFSKLHVHIRVNYEPNGQQ